MDEILVDALTLTRFSNLESTQVEEFKNNAGKSFLPDQFWNASALGSLNKEKKLAWLQAQAFLRQAWKKGFPLQESITLITLVGFYSKIFQDVAPEHLKDFEGNAGGENVDADDVAGSESLPPEPPDLNRMPDVWPFQRAVMFFATNPHRAVFCPRCSNRFFKVEKNTKYCSNKCAQGARLDSKREWWSDKGKEWRSKAKKATRKGRSK